MRRIVIVITGLLVSLGGGGARAAAVADPAGVQFFESEIRPLLVDSCLKCHGVDPEKVKGGLKLTSRAELLKGGDTGPAVDEKNPGESLLLKMVNWADDDHQMPPKKKLPQQKIELLARWVKLGCPWTPGAEAPAVAAAPQEDPKDYWAYKKPMRPALPTVSEPAWVRSPVDAFILAKLDAAGLKPNAPADKLTLIRRATYDLTGLPPTQGEIRDFLADTSPEAFERVVDRLLASPHYGEKWGRHWLDLVGYAETNGYERDSDKPNAWRYRDYVVNSFNADKPYDRFLKEQLAGDELPNATPETIIATGYYRLGIWDDDPADHELASYDVLDGIVGTTSQVMLGMSMNCARCHNHKRDPIPQEDYYRMLAFFHSIRPMAMSGPNVEAVIRRDAVAERAQAERLAVVGKQVGEYERKLSTALHVEPGQDVGADNFDPLVREKGPAILGFDEYHKYRAARVEYRKLKAQPTAGERALCVTEFSRPVDTFVLGRGSPQNKQKQVRAGFPRVLGGGDAAASPNEATKTTGQRTALANWIASADNPATARVMVNRIWQYHFGRGIVPTPNDFGKLGQLPTHPELLDWLATEFVARGWDVKAMHKLLMLSSAYQMSSADEANALAKDPQNDLFWRFNMRRLTAEEIRDSILAVNGTLNLKLGGPSVFPPMPAEVLATSSRPNEAWGRSSPEDAARRSLYVKVKRSLLYPVMSTYDFADTDTSTPVRFTTTVPTQALTMLNSAFVNEQAEVLARKLEAAAPGDTAREVTVALADVTQHAPTQREVDRGVAFIRDLQEKDHLSRPNALTAFCLLSLNLNEFVYLD